MNVSGIIAEYNPFHNGHQYHIEQTRNRTGCDYIVVAMSPSFSQRGEPMLIDKWARTRMALMHGADLVVELPTLFAVRSADWFARGGVRLLEGLNVIDTLSFGCETTDRAALFRAADVLAEEPEPFRRALREKLNDGKSHARARGEALAEVSGIDLNGRPNLALALEYIRANRQLAQPMDILPIQRTGAYHDMTVHHYASASAIRRALWDGEEQSAYAAMSASAAALLRPLWPNGAARSSAMDELLLYRLRSMNAAELAALPDIAEGLDRRLMAAAREATSREELLSRMKCKRYTHARLSRLCMHALLGMDRPLIDGDHRPPYARALGFRKDAVPLLRAIKERSRVPFITDPVRLKGNRCFELEKRATDLRGLLTKESALRKTDRDYREKMIVME